jgi:hypothetical protein
MKQSILLYTLTLLAGTTVAAKTCTPSFDYCADKLIKSKGTLFPLLSILSPWSQISKYTDNVSCA